MKTRRAFLKQLAFGTDRVIAEPRTLVCVFLRGGADTLNMIVPYGDDDYYKARPTISIRGAQSANKLDDFYAFHPKLAPLLPIFREGRLAVVQAVGSDNGSGSHFDAQEQMEHGEAYERKLSGGWLGRYLAARAGGNITPLTAVAIGATIPESLRGAPTTTVLRSIDEVQIRMPSGDAAAVSAALASLYSQELDILGAAGRDTLQLLTKIDALRHKDNRPANGAVYPDNDFSRGLAQVARLVKANVGLEIACIDSDGWDTHFVQGAGDGLQAGRIEELANGLGAFDKDVAEHHERVVVLVITEFGRRIYENASLGTDHGRGFAAMVLGAGVNGGKVYGDWPGLEDNREFTLGPSGLSIRHDYRSLLGEVLAQSIDAAHLGRVFPDYACRSLGVCG